MEQNSKTKSFVGKFIVPSLFISGFSLFIVDIITRIFLPDISMAFFGSSDPIDIAITSQLVTISSGASVIVGLLLCFLSVKYDHKKLLVLGVLCIPVGALGCSLAPNFIFMQIFYTIEGIGTAIAGVMNLVLLGEMLPLTDKPKATGWVMSGGAFANIAGNLVISFFFKDPGSWRAFLLWFALPISLIALAAAYFGVPSLTQKRTETIGKTAYINAFKQIFRNRSATACLIGNMLALVSMMWAIYYLAFFRAELGLSIADGALVAVGAIVVGTSGRIMGGYFVNRIGRKRLPVITMVFEGLTLPFLAFVPELWIAVVILYLNNFIGSFGNPGLINLIFEQVPEFRGTMMSINNVFIWLGTTIGAGIGGFVLAMFNYTGNFIVFALLILTTAGFLFFFTEDPCREKQKDLNKT